MEKKVLNLFGGSDKGSDKSGSSLTHGGINGQKYGKGRAYTGLYITIPLKHKSNKGCFQNGGSIPCNTYRSLYQIGKL